MLHAYLFLILLLYSTSDLLCQESISTNSHEKNPVTITSCNISSKPEKIREIIKIIQLKKGFPNNQQISTFTNEDIEEMELVFESSPKEAQCIVNHLQDSTFFPDNKDYRAAYFVGEPGSGKTMMAKAIAYKMSEEGWDYRFISSSQLHREYRNQTAIQLQKELQAAASSHKPTIIIIDELNRLLENFESKNHDTDTTATALWTFLDQQKNNENFFFIGTMNRITKLPKPFKDRILFDYIDFQLITDSSMKANILRKHLTTKQNIIDSEVTNDLLYKELEKIGPCSGRNLKKISGAIHKIQRSESLDKTTPIVIKKVSIIKAIHEYLQRKEKIQYDLEDETDEERQERHHTENMTLQKKHRDEQLLLQKENQQNEEFHFVQQQIMQVALADYQERLTSGGHPYRLEPVQVLGFAFSDEQIDLYNTMMSATHQRRIKEKKEKKNAAKKAAAENAKGSK